MKARGGGPAPARVLSVNVGHVREVTWQGRTVRTGMLKHPVAGRVPVRGVNLDGDDQADRTAHGGADKAVYAYAQEDYRYWREREGVDALPGLYGENLTVEGMDLRRAVVGERWRVGTAVLEVAQPRLPCAKLGIRMHDAGFPRRFQAAGRPGAYLRIVVEGDIAASDHVQVVHRPSHGVTLRSMLEALADRRRAAALLRGAALLLPDFWRGLAEGG